MNTTTAATDGHGDCRTSSRRIKHSAQVEIETRGDKTIVEHLPDRLHWNSIGQINWHTRLLDDQFVCSRRTENRSVATMGLVGAVEHITVDEYDD